MDYQQYRYDAKLKYEDIPTEIDLGKKSELKNLQQVITEEISEIQERLYAENKQALLVIFQGIDAAGKDSSIRWIFSGVNPQGVEVSSFKSPTKLEYRHDYLWRHYRKLPPKGIIGVHNRSHYENVLVCRVHPEYLLNENYPGIETVADVDDAFWEQRYAQIRQFEEMQINSGTRILKFLLKISKKEQMKRFRDRLEKPEDNWKFSSADFEESALWDEYSSAFAQMLENTSNEAAPWFVIPCDDKASARLIMAHIIRDTLLDMDPKYPLIAPEDAEKNTAIHNQLKENTQ